MHGHNGLWSTGRRGCAGTIGCFGRPRLSPVTVERRLSGDAEELFRLYQEVFGEGLTSSSRTRWRWQYLENPLTPEEGIQIWVAREGEALLGQYASMPVRLFWGGHEVRSSWGMDVFLRPEARGKGIGALLFTTWSGHVEVALGLGLTPSSYGLFKKLRYDDVGPVPFFQKILDPRAIARRRLGPWLGTGAGVALRAALAVGWPERARPPDAVTVAPITRFGPEYDTLWERCRGGYAMCVRRDAAYLNWKYVSCPTRRYALHEARRSGTLAGFAVSRHEDYQGLRLGWIVDVFADPADATTKDALLGAVLRDFRDNGVARAQAFSMNTALGADLRRRGFAAARSPMQFCVRAKIPSAGVFAEPGRWHVVFGDSDMDR
jgi:GNAT superfamily N-acetyltransferase